MARCLPSLPLISGALAKGEISYSKVRALTRIADAGNEAELLAFARHGTTAHVERLVRSAGGLSLWLTDDGSYEVRGRLNPEVGSLLLKVLEVADALGLWLEERVQPRVQLVVHSLEGDEAPVSLVTAPLVTEEGSCVSAETSSRLACDAEVVHIARAGDGSVLDVGRRQRSVGWRLRKALEARDGGCRFPGCGSRLRTHAHHITPWARGGETSLSNLVLLCPFHHRAVHEGGWRVEMDERGVPRFFNPLGVRMSVVPEPPDVGHLLPRGAPACRAQDFGLSRWHAQGGIGARTGTTAWQGERLDWGWAMACLRSEPAPTTKYVHS